MPVTALPPPIVWIVFAGLLLVVAVGYWRSLKTKDDPSGGPTDLLGQAYAQFGAGLPKGLTVVLGGVWAALFASLVFGIFWVIWSAFYQVWTLPPDTGGTSDAEIDLRWYLITLTAITAALGGVIALPFTILRTRYSQSQTETAAESLFNDKINAAAEDLGRQRQVTKTVILPDGNEELRDVWEDDLVTRAAAIDRLEGLAEERHDAAPRIARLLSVYVRELSAEHGAQDHRRYQFLRLTEPEDDSEPYDKNEALDIMDVSDEAVSRDSLKGWARGLKPVRSDMEKAAQTLGRLKLIEGIDADTVPIDLRGANLQGFDLKGLCLDTALLQEARMEGARLFRARMGGADLTKARMEGAILSGARMERADLHGARMEGAYLGEARMEGADLWGARMEGADLGGARFDEKTNFREAVVQYAAVQNSDLSTSNVSPDQVSALFGDELVTLPDGIDRPAHWPEEALDSIEFVNRWRAWQREQGYEPQLKGE